MPRILTSPGTEAANKIVLKVCSAPSDYVTMFGMNKDTCMKIHPGNHTVANWHQLLWQDMKKMHNIHPASWYHYQPYAAGFYVVKKNNHIDVLMRGMLYKNDPETDAPWRAWGDVKFADNLKPNDPEISGAFMRGVLQTLAYNGITDYRQRMQKTICSYSIPSFNHPVFGSLCPLAHCDQQDKDFAVLYKDGRFHFFRQEDAPSGALHIFNTYIFDGYITRFEAEHGLSRRLLRTPSWSNLLNKYLVENAKRLQDTPTRALQVEQDSRDHFPQNTLH